jgi:pimeloyl-ACP methyl ester carboxylesterase
MTPRSIDSGANTASVRRRWIEPVLLGSITSVLVLVLVGQATLGWPHAVARPTGPAGGIVWQPCGEGVECGALLVPVDHARADGPRIELALARHRAEDRAGRRGVLLINPGGPGGSGTDLIMNTDVLESFPSAIRRYFDLIGFDPRGVPTSAPLRCKGAGSWRTSPRDRQEFTQLVTGQRSWIAGCVERTGDLVNHLDSRSVASDIEAIRVALGEDRINWLGYSYGTMFGLTYAEMFPKRIRAMVLDSVVDHSKWLEDLVVTEAVAEEVVFVHFARWCEDTPTCALHGRNVGAVWDELVARAAQAPSSADGQQLDDEELQGSLTHLLSPPSRWPQAARLIANASGTGDAGRVEGLVPAPSRDFDAGALLTVSYCSDYPLRSHDYDAIWALAAKVASRAPRFGTYITWRDVGICAGWQAPASNPPHPLRVAGLPPVLLVNATGDFATPLADARTVADQLPARSFITVEADTHGVYRHGMECVDTWVNQYLVDLVQPPPEVRCDSS